MTKIAVTVIEHRVLDIGTWSEIICPDAQTKGLVKKALSSIGRSPSTESETNLAYVHIGTQEVREALASCVENAREDQKLLEQIHVEQGEPVFA